MFLWQQRRKNKRLSQSVHLCGRWQSTSSLFKRARSHTTTVTSIQYLIMYVSHPCAFCPPSTSPSPLPLHLPIPPPPPPSPSLPLYLVKQWKHPVEVTSIQYLIVYVSHPCAFCPPSTSPSSPPLPSPFPLPLPITPIIPCQAVEASGQGASSPCAQTSSEERTGHQI